MTAYDPDLYGSDLDLDSLDFDTRDAVEAGRMDRFSAAMSGHEIRPGVHRRIGDPFAEDPMLAIAVGADDAQIALDFDLPPALLVEAS